MGIIGFLCDITGITEKFEKALDTVDKIDTVFFRDVETERGKDATVEVAKKYEIILAEMTEKFKKVMEMMENKKEELSKECDDYLIELEELEKKAKNLEKILKEKILKENIRENYTSDNTNNGISQPQSIMGPNPDPVPIPIPNLMGDGLNFLYSRKIKKGEIAYQKKYEEMEILYKQKISILNKEYDKKEKSSDSDIRDLTETIKETLNEMAIVKEKIVKIEEGIWYE